MIALPGIIDAHTCLWQTVLRGYVPDLWPGAYYSAATAAPAALQRRGQLQRGLCRRLRDAVLRHHHRRRLLPQHPQPRLRRRLDRGAGDGGHPAPVHLFLHGRRADEFPLAARYDDARRVYDRFHDPKSLTTIGFGVDSIGARGAREATGLRAGLAGAELHPCQRDRHHRPAARGRPARAGLPGHPRQPDHQCRARR